MNTYLNYIHVHWNLFRSHDSTFVLGNFTRSAISDIYIYACFLRTCYFIRKSWLLLNNNFMASAIFDK